MTGAVLLVCTIAAAVFYSGANDTAEITVNGEVVETLNLHRDQRFTVKTEWGENTVVVENGTIWIAEATCLDQVCVRRGACRSGIPIVCLPNRLVISFSNVGAADASN